MNDLITHDCMKDFVHHRFGKERSIVITLHDLLVRDRNFIRENPERYVQTFSQTNAGKKIMKLFKKKTIMFSQRILGSNVRRGDERVFRDIMIDSNVSMPENVYYNYYTTKVGYKEDYYKHTYVIDGVKINKEFHVPDIENYGDGTRVRDFVFTYLHIWLAEMLGNFVAGL